jgi:hypothetical protein
MRRRLRAALAAGLAMGTVLGMVAASPALGESNGLAATPLMGWSSWSFIRTAPTAAKIEAEAAAMKSSGLSAHGYDYVNLDDYWMACNSDGPEVDAYGRWIANTTEFPTWMPPIWPCSRTTR